MKQMNGKLVVEAQLVTRFEFSEDEVNQVLAAPSEKQREALNSLLNTKLPSENSCSDFIVREFKSAVAAALVVQRENQLKQLPEVAGQEVES